MSYTIPNIILWAKISQSLAARDIAISKTKGIIQNERLPEILYDVRTSIEWKYSKNSSDSTLFNTGDYLYSLCGKYLAQAKKLAAVGGGISITPNSPNYFSAIEGFDIEITVGSGQPIVSGQTSYVLPYPNIIKGTVQVQMPQSNVPIAQSNQFSYTINYGLHSTTILFANDDGSGSNNLGAQDGMLIMIKGLRIVTSAIGISGVNMITIDGTQISADSYSDISLAGFNLLVYYNGNGYLNLGVDFTVKTTGGFTLIGSYAGQTYTASDKFIVTPNGLI